MTLIYCYYMGNLNLKDFSKYLQNAGLMVCVIGAFIVYGGLSHGRTFDQQYIGTMSQYKTHERIKLMLKDQKKNYAVYFLALISGVSLILIGVIINIIVK